MHGLGKPAALRAGQGKPRIVFLAAIDHEINELAGLLRPRMPAFTLDVHDPFDSTQTSDATVALVLLHPSIEGDLTTYLVTGRRLYPNAAMGLLVDGGLSSSSVELMQSGLIKGLVPTDLDVVVLTAVLAVLFAGGEYCPPDLMLSVTKPRAVVSREREDLPNYAAHRLTPRETQIMALLSKGLQNKIIAAQMGLSEHTVKAHVRNLFAKLRVSNRTQAVAKCRDWLGDSRRDRLNEPVPGSSAALHLSAG